MSDVWGLFSLHEMVVVFGSWSLGFSSVSVLDVASADYILVGASQG